ncbi:MAG TPA: tetratricopeptide repeat protein [Bacteroidia bacterium]
MRPFLLILALLCGATMQMKCYGQDQAKIDSLKNILKQNLSDTVRVNTLSDLCNVYNNAKDEENTIEYANLLVGVTDSLLLHETVRKKVKLLKRAKSEAISMLGVISYNYADYEEALNYFQEVLLIRKEIMDEKGCGRAELNIGLVYKNKGDYAVALDHYLAALKIYERIDDKKGISTAYNNIGILYSKGGDRKKALEYYTKAFEMYKGISDKKGMSSALINIGIIYNKNKEYQKALDHYFKAIKLKEEVKDIGGIASACNNIGNVYDEQKKFDKAIEYFNKSLELKQSIHDKQGITLSYNNIGSVYAENGNYKKAEEYLLKSLVIAKEIGSLDDIKDAHYNLSDLYQKTSESVKALEHYKEFIVARDSLFNAESTKKMVRSEMNFEFEKKQQLQKLESEKKEAIQQEKLSNQRVGVYALVFIIGLLLAFSITLFRSYKSKKRQSDIIHEKNLELEKLSIVASETASGVFITNANGDIEWFNDGFSKLFGWSSIEQYKEQRGKNIYAVSGNENIKEIIKQAVNDKISVTYENAVTDMWGKELWIKTALTPVFNEEGKLQQMIFIETDVSELKRAKETAEQSLQIQEQFLANTSHEIRTPMNGVLGMTRQLMETPLNEEQLEYLTAIKESSNSLLRVVNDILDISKIRAGKIVFEKIDFKIADLFRTLQFTLQYKAGEKNIALKMELDKEIPEVLLGDPVRLNQILINLAGNAIKFTDQGQVVIKAEKEVKNGKETVVRFSVSDSGVGIPGDKLDYIFEAFAQAETHTTRKYGGTGLGLSISRFLVEQQGGKINVNSLVGKGSVFSFSLKFEEGNPEWKGIIPHHTDVLTEEDNLENAEVLLIEDNRINQRVAEYELKKWKIKVEIADDAILGLEKLKNKKYDLILMDISMPGMDGIEATKRIRKDFPAPVKDTPIMAMTASALIGEKEKCFEAGMNDYISKPFDPVVFHSKLIKWIKPRKTDIPEVKQQEHTRKRITDLGSIIEQAEGDLGYIREMIEIYVQSMPEYLSELNFFFEQKNWQEVKKQAHKMKTPAVYFGAIELKDLLYRVEIYTAQNSSTELFVNTVKRINDLCMQSCKELNEELVKMNQV